MPLSTAWNLRSVCCRLLHSFPTFPSFCFIKTLSLWSLHEFIFLYESKISEHGHFTLKNKKEAYLGFHLDADSSPLSNPTCGPLMRRTLAASQQGRKGERETVTCVRDHIPQSKVRGFRATFAAHKGVPTSDQCSVITTLTPSERTTSVGISLRCPLA